MPLLSWNGPGKTDRARKQQLPVNLSDYVAYADNQVMIEESVLSYWIQSQLIIQLQSFG